MSYSVEERFRAFRLMEVRKRCVGSPDAAGNCQRRSRSLPTMSPTRSGIFQSPADSGVNPIRAGVLRKRRVTVCVPGRRCRLG